MKIKNLLLSGLMLVSGFAFATPEDAAKVFKKELREDAIAYIKAKDENKELYIKFASLLNKEFGKEIVYLEVLKSGKFGIEKKTELTPKEKMIKIITTLTPEIIKKPAAGPLGDIKLTFDLYDEIK